MHPNSTGAAQFTQEASVLYQPISCDDYDRLEISCMDRYEVELNLGDQVLTGVASRLETREGEEYLWLRESSGNDRPVRVDRIRSMSVLTRPTRFRHHTFANAD
jgi:Rho-binding antiterminator